MKKEANIPFRNQTDNLDKLLTLLEQEGRTSATPKLQDLYERLYQSLYTLRDFSVDFEVRHSNTLKSKVLKLYRRIWRIGASPYIRYHNQFHAVLINTIFIQNAILKELETKIEQGQQNNE